MGLGDGTIVGETTSKHWGSGDGRRAAEFRIAIESIVDFVEIVR